MTEEPLDSMRHAGDYMVCVKAQVMTRDDSTGGWVPLGGGGFSTVVLRKVHVISTSSDQMQHNEYFIHGQRSHDKSVVLNCALRKDVEYTQVNPTFHHWCTEQQRFGLTFQSSADAKAFERGVRRAVDDLLDECGDNNVVNKSEVGDDEVFMPLQLPWDRKGSCSQSASTISTTTSSPSPQSPGPRPISDAFTNNTLVPAPGCVYSQHSQQHLHRLHYVNKHPDRPERADRPINPRQMGLVYEDNSNPELWVHSNKPPEDPNIAVATNYSYVQFSRSHQPTHSSVHSSVNHEYSYPSLDTVSPHHQHYTRTHPPPRVNNFSSVKKHHNLDINQPALPMKNKKKHKDRYGVGKSREKKAARLLQNQRQRCKYCHEFFTEDDNHRGSCDDAPDCLSDCIERVACTCCARGMLYHCMSDSDGDYGHPCSCDTGTSGGNCAKWTALGVLSLFVPCLCCYWPLTMCHRCGVACGCCGGRHKPA